MKAVIKTGGKQYIVKEGDTIKVEKLSLSPGKKVEFKEVLMIEGEKGSKVGTPFIKGASVKGEVLEEGKDKKIIVYKYKSKKGYHKKKGHRQPYTLVKIVSIIDGKDKIK